MTFDERTQMKTKHTPGKWKSQGQFIGTDEEDSQTIAYLSDHRNNKQRSQTETKANGRLIENAPDLLETLVLLLKKINNSSLDDWVDYNIDAKIVEIENAYKLIEKIDGFDSSISEHGSLMTEV